MDSPAQSASVFGNDNIVVQGSGSGVNVTIGAQPHLRLTRYVNQTKLEIQRDSETAWLSAYRTDVIPLIGRKGILADLRAWLETDNPVSIRVLIGAGGRGKTRLALELAREISEEGWLAGFATAENFDRFRRQNGVEDWRWDKPILIIIDNAASRAGALQGWIGELVDARGDELPKLRLLLLERQADPEIGWLATTFALADHAKSLLDPQKPAELPPLDALEFRRQVFSALLKWVNAKLEAPPAGADPEFDRQLRNQKWAGEPLYLMMAALAVAKAGVQNALTLSSTDLALSFGRDELERIGRIAAAQGVDDTPRSKGAFARHMAAFATLLQGLTPVEAREFARREKAALDSAASLDATIAALRDALPTADGKGIAPILPDVVGEGAILAWFGEKGALATIGVDATERIIAMARASVGKASATLVRTAQDFAASGFVEPVRWLGALAGAPETDLGALITIGDALPNNTQSLREFAAELSTRIVKMMEGRVAPEGQPGYDIVVQSLYATALHNLGLRLGDVGRLEDALVAAQKAVDIRRRLAARRADAFLPDLARSLTNLAADLMKVGRAEAALAAALEATDINRHLAARQPDERSLSNLARSLQNVAVSSADLGRHEDALAAAQESAETHRRLAVANPDAFLPGLAQSLNNLGVHFGELGRHEQSFSVAQEATNIYRRLVAARPDSFLPELAASLDNLGTSFSEFGHREEALTDALEAVAIRRRLAEAQPDAFLPDLASSLNNLGNRLSELGRREDALAAEREATDIYRRLAALRPDVFSPRLAGSLDNLGNAFGALGRSTEALAAAREAVDAYHRLATTLPGAFQPDLAGSLNNLGVQLSRVGQREEALAAAKEATDISRRLAAAQPDAFLPVLGASLSTVGDALGDLGRREEALTATQEATDIYRRLVTLRPDMFSPDLARSLNNLGDRLSNLGRSEEALGAAQLAVDAYRRLAGALPEAFLPSLAGSLTNLGGVLSDVGRRDEALAAAEKAVDIYRRLVAASPSAFLPEFATSLDNLRGRLGDHGRLEDALTAAQQASDILRRLADAHPDKFLPQHAKSLYNLGLGLSALGRHVEALAAAREATEIFRRLATADPDAFIPDFAASLNSVGNRLDKLRRPEEALAVSQEAIKTLAPSFLKLPATYAQQMVIMAQRYLQLSETLGVEPDAALLTPIDDALGTLPDFQVQSNATS